MSHFDFEALEMAAQRLSAEAAAGGSLVSETLSEAPPVLDAPATGAERLADADPELGCSHRRGFAS